MNPDEMHIRSLIVDEIKRQLTPFFRTIEKTEETVDSTKDMLLRLFSGNPHLPGYLETARAIDEKRFENLEKGLEVRFAGIESKLKAIDKAQDPARRLKRWIMILTFVIVFLTFVLGAWGVMKGFKIATQELRIPQRWLDNRLQDFPLPAVEAKEMKPRHQAADDPTWQPKEQ